MSEQQTVAIRPARGLVPLDVAELWRYRELAGFFLWRELKSRYRQMALGPLWMILQPLLNMVIFTIIFSGIANIKSGTIPYPLFNYSALLLFGFFTQCVTATSGSLLKHKDLISKVYFPRLLVPVVGVMTAAIEFLISALILVGMMTYYSIFPTWTLIWIPVFLLATATIGLAVGLWAATWVLHFRDIDNMISFGVRAWMYACPVVYPVSLIAEKYSQWEWLYWLNPMVPVMEGYRWALFGVGAPPALGQFLPVLVAFPLLIGGAYYFRRTERNVVDIA